MMLNAYLTPYTKINLNGSKIWRRANTVKFLGKNIGKNIHGIDFGNGFLDMTPKTVTKNRQLDFIKIKSFCVSKDTIKKAKR
jgi:hypothetical protein